MTRRAGRAIRGGRLAVAVATAALLAVPAGTAGGVAGSSVSAEAASIDIDARQGSVRPSTTQRAIARDMGAIVRWNRFGTPSSLFRVDGALASGLSSDPLVAARQFLQRNRALFRLEEGVGSFDVVAVNRIGRGHAVLLRQRFGGLRAGTDGLIALAVMDGRVLYVTSSLSGDTSRPPAPALGPIQAWVRAARALGFSLEAADIGNVGRDLDWTTFDARGLVGTQRSRLVAVPTFTQGVRPAYETIVLNDVDPPLAATTFVDAVTGEVLVRVDRVDEAGEPAWKVFPDNPPLNYSSTDTRERWCWHPGAGCDRVVSRGAPRAQEADAWDRLQAQIPAVAFLFPVTFTTLGNNADTSQAWLSPLTPAERYRPVEPSRNYVYPWNNTWFQSDCDPSVLTPRGNDIDAAIVNLFAMHNRMHDWSYHLGFTERTWNLQFHNFGRAPFEAREGDPETGDAQAGALNVGPAEAVARDNANQVTLNDGIPGITNMYLWQPLPAAAYVPCVDGDFDMAVIGHEYTHAISNRMVAGPDAGLTDTQSRSMGESWSDLSAVEYLHEYGFLPPAGVNPFAVGTYVTGDHEKGIRNYAMNDSPLNYSDIQYDFGSQVHADGEIWSAANYDIRQAMIQRYGAGDPATQEQCADGDLPAQVCPGNRRWIQIMFDAWLLMQSNVDMVDARNAYLVADQLRFGGANQDILWNAFARRGLGAGASSRGGNDNDPEPDFTSPYALEARVTFKPAGLKGAPAPTNVEVFVGDYEARVTPIADTIPAQSGQPDQRDATADFVPGRYTFVARADGFGHVRFALTLAAGQTVSASIPMPENVASRHRGATATGDGANHLNLIDDTEETNWQRNGNPPVRGVQVTVDLAGTTARPVKSVRVSSMLVSGQNRFAALRQFEILTCTATATSPCTNERFSLLYTSPPDAIPGEGWRPRAPQLIMRSFDVPDTSATHVRLRVVTNQCTGVEAYQGDQDNDPTNDSDCVDSITNPALPPQGGNVIAAELQVLGVN